ncbi:MAG: cell division protein FtsA [Verrucomicrobiota bacterium]|jgi:cell division protein FtsA|nr:cell division protein FtsA [Verrucomicrobiota bacterium]
MMNMEPIVALEIGTSHVRVFVGEAREDDGLMITAVGSSPSSGMRKGELFHYDSVTSCIETALRQAEEAADIVINEVYLTMSGSQIESLPSRGEMPVDGEIGQDHVEHVLKLAKEVALPADRQILHSIVGQYSVDGLQGVMPVGMVGEMLAVDVLIVHGIHSRMLNLIRAVKSLKLDVKDLLFSGLCSAMAVLSAEQKLQGALVIDLGGGTTDYVVYAQARIADAGVIGVGGDHVTNDIARAFRLSTQEAEQVKLRHGDALISAAGRTRRLPLSAVPGEAARAIKLRDLQTVIHERMDEMFGLIRSRLQEQNLLHQLGAGVVLTGGGAHMANLAHLAEKVFGLPCEVGVPRNVCGMAANLALPKYATGIGALLCGYKSARMQAEQARSIWRKVGHWFGVGGLERGGWR